MLHPLAHIRIVDLGGTIVLLRAHAKITIGFSANLKRSYPFLWPCVGGLLLNNAVSKRVLQNVCAQEFKGEDLYITPLTIGNTFGVCCCCAILCIVSINKDMAQ